MPKVRVETLENVEDEDLELFRDGRGSEVPVSTPEGFCVFLSDPDLESKICEYRTQGRSHFSISAVTGVCVVIS